jgi:hypothetical protein
MSALQIEEGKFYRSVEGKKVGPMKKDCDGDFYATSHDEMLWRADGRRLWGDSDLVLIAEWGIGDTPESPLVVTPTPRGWSADVAAVDYAVDETGAIIKDKDGRLAALRAAEAPSLSRPVAGATNDAPAQERMTKRRLLETAIEAVADRGLNYGRPEDNFRRIARLWSTHLVNRYGEGFGGDTTVAVPALDEHDVAQMMILMKVARLENSPKHADSAVDIAGYAACIAELP